MPDRILTSAFVRPPGASFARALSSSGRPIDVALACRQHDEYCAALREARISVEVLPPDERFPDSCFMQDPALVVGGVAVILRPAEASRAGEADLIAETLEPRFPTARVVSPGTIEGGDVMVLPQYLLVGQSGRTNRAGIAQLAVSLARLLPDGAPGVAEAPVPAGLHLLSAVTYVGKGVLVATAKFAEYPAFAELDVVTVPEGEEGAANVLGVGGYAIMPAGYPNTAGALRSRGFQVLPVPTSEFAKADGGVTCLSLIW